MPKHLAPGLVFVMALLSACGPTGSVDERFGVIVDGILSAWSDADLVCLGENHGSQLDADLRLALVEDPAFLDTVDVVVLESASGVHQGLLDRFILEGEELTREQLQPIWRDAGRGAPWELPIVEELLRAVRRVNLGVPRPRRVRVIGGAVPIPWETIRRPEDLMPWVDRERLLGETIRREIFARNLEGLAVFGSFHCEKTGTSFAAALHREYPGRVWSAFAFAPESGVREGAARLGLGPEPILVPITTTAFADEPAGAAFFEGHAFSGATFGQLLDAAISYGNVPDTVSFVDEETLDPAFRREISRRDRLQREAGSARHQG